MGSPIAPADRDRVFDRFYRAAGAPNRPPGTGLGLSIVKRIVDAPPRPCLGGEQPCRCVGFRLRVAGRHDRPYMSSQGRILITDDEPDLRRALHHTASRHWDSRLRKPPTASRQWRSLKTADSTQYSSTSTCREPVAWDLPQAAACSTRGLQILMLTVRDSEGDKVKALDAGADDYITKPFSIPEACRPSAFRRPPGSLECSGHGGSDRDRRD